MANILDDDDINFFLGYFVYQNKLCVSTRVCSSEFDTITGEWSACHMFADRHVNSGNLARNLAGNLGKPFPFCSQGLVLFENYLVCMEKTHLFPFVSRN